MVETHNRQNTAAQIRDLEVLPPKEVSYRGATFMEMDLDAILARRPELALVDELAHTNLPGNPNHKRWQDIDVLLDAGIEVITTVNIQHLESLNDVVERITGVVQRETVPDAVVRAADQIELVDMSPEALRRRLAHGNVYSSDKVDTALANYFRVGNLTALRELALLWVADKVEEGLQAYREAHGIAGGWETKERVVVALTGSPKGDQLIRRAARMAARAKAELVGVHIRVSDGLSESNAGAALERDRALLAEVGGRFEEITGGDVAQALVEFARVENATQLVIGATLRSRWNELLRGSIVNRVIRASNDIDVHVISTSEAHSESATDTEVLPKIALRGRLAPMGTRRRALGWLLATVGMAALRAGPDPRPPHHPRHRRPAAAPARHHRGGSNWRALPRRRGGSRRLRIRRLVLHHPIAQLHHRPGRRHGRPCGVPRRRHRCQRDGRSARPSPTRHRPSPQRGRKTGSSRRAVHCSRVPPQSATSSTSYVAPSASRRSPSSPPRPRQRWLYAASMDHPGLSWSSAAGQA